MKSDASFTSYDMENTRRSLFGEANEPNCFGELNSESLNGTNWVGTHCDIVSYKYMNLLRLRASVQVSDIKNC